MKTDELILLDTNILVYGHQEESEFHGRSRSILQQGFEGKAPLCVCPQVLIEFYATITNLKRVTNPAPPQEAIGEIEKYLQSRCIQKIYAGENAWEYTSSLLKRYTPKGMKVFDLQLVATMLANNVHRIYTFNRDDFLRFTEVDVLTP